MNPDWTSFPTSSLIALLRSGVKLLLCCMIGLTSGRIFSLYVMTFESMPGMSLCNQVKTLPLASKNSTSVLMDYSDRLVPILTICSFEFSQSDISSSGSTGYTRCSSRYSIAIVSSDI